MAEETDSEISENPKEKLAMQLLLLLCNSLNDSKFKTVWKNENFA